MADNAPRITIEELKRRLEAGEDFVFVDTRNPQAWAQSDSKIPEAIHLSSLDNVEEILPKLPKDKPIVTYCT
jgi:rhodanese-related sulfurtransferase